MIPMFGPQTTGCMVTPLLRWVNYMKFHRTSRTKYLMCDMHLHSSCQVTHCHLRYLVLADSLDTDVDMDTQRHTISTYRLLFIRSHIIVNIWVPTLL